jgi:YHS domain-containing protein
MTAMLRARARGRLVAALLAAAFCLGAADGAPARDLVATDPMTGFAIRGFDPVAYFIHSEPRPGTVEAEWGGVTWRFVNEGNRAAFLDAPQVYAPRFGGICALGMARGIEREADPHLWAIHRGQLYFFQTPVDRTIWLEQPDRFAAEGARHWRDFAQPGASR